MFSGIAHFTEGGSTASPTSREPDFGPASSLLAAPRSGAEVGHGALGEAVAIIELLDPAKDARVEWVGSIRRSEIGTYL